MVAESDGESSQRALWMRPRLVLLLFLGTPMRPNGVCKVDVDDRFNKVSSFGQPTKAFETAIETQISDLSLPGKESSRGRRRSLIGTVWVRFGSSFKCFDWMEEIFKRCVRKLEMERF